METRLEAKLISLTQPTIETRIPSAEGLIAYCARVSSPDNQDKFDTTEGLISYCMKNHHWSVFEMVDATVEIEAPRDISRQLLRHRSFSFQEFSQRYSDQISFTMRDIRLQDKKNRQNSFEADDPDFVKECQEDFFHTVQAAQDNYSALIKDGVAKECARVLLPEGLTMSRLYMKGSLRSWLHYLQVREGNGTQKEHIVLAGKIREAIRPAFPMIFKVYENE
jgi:thymidylate synthase (FAD)